MAPIEGTRRPVVVLTRDVVLPLLARVTVVPVTRTARGIPSEVALTPGVDGVREPSVASLDNLATLRKADLSRRLGRVSAPTMSQICDALTFALGC